MGKPLDTDSQSEGVPLNSEGRDPSVHNTPSHSAWHTSIAAHAPCSVSISVPKDGECTPEHLKDGQLSPAPVQRVRVMFKGFAVSALPTLDISRNGMVRRFRAALYLSSESNANSITSLVSPPAKTGAGKP